MGSAPADKPEKSVKISAVIPQANATRIAICPGLRSFSSSFIAAAFREVARRPSQDRACRRRRTGIAEVVVLGLSVAV